MNDLSLKKKSCGGSNMSKLKEVADRAGVSKATVSRVINNSSTIAESTRKKVLEVIGELNFKAQELKRSSEGSLMVGMILPFQQSPTSFGLDILLGAEGKSFENDYLILLGNSKYEHNRERNLINMMMNRGIEGLIVLTKQGCDFDNLSFIDNYAIPYVLVDQRIEGLKSNMVRGDNLSSGIHLMHHLFSLGHSDIALIGPTLHSTYEDRIRAYQIALLEKDISLPPYYIQKMKATSDNAYKMVNNLLAKERKPTALYVTVPTILTQVVQAVKDSGLRIPEDISIVTFDEKYVSLPEENHHFFTSVNQSGQLMGSMAMELLLQRIKNPHLDNQEITLPGSLTIQKSTGAVPAKY